MTRTLALATALLALARTAAAQTPAAAPEPLPQVAPAATETAPAVAPAATAPAVATEPPATQPAAAPQAAPPPPPQAVAPVQPTPAAAAVAPAEEKVPLRKRIFTWASIGTTFAYGNTYGNANLGAGYMWKAGLTPNLEASYMWGASPTIWALRPGITWYSSIPVLRPYVGAYYTRWFVSNQPDENGVGGRLGISLGRLLSLGVTYDRVLNCSSHCDAWTPIISAGASL